MDDRFLQKKEFRYILLANARGCVYVCVQEEDKICVLAWLSEYSFYIPFFYLCLFLTIIDRMIKINDFGWLYLYKAILGMFTTQTYLVN